MSDYDPEARRQTPLALKLKERIRRDGAITVAQYMEACLTDPDHGYYVGRTAIGAGGDFITAPEISQVFGELIGLWAAVVWQQMGAPREIDIVELGPGRGTLMADALRALAKVPGCLPAVRVRLIEVSPALRGLQQARLAGSSVPITWHSALQHAVQSEHAIVLANEFLDTAPVAQFTSEGERRVTMDSAGELQFCLRRLDGSLGPAPDPSAIVERCDRHGQLVAELAALPRVAALLIDYGHAIASAGDTLQAVRAHRYEHPLTSPGEADLTAQVDFAALGTRLSGGAFFTDGPITQAELLGALGIAERASRLMAANPSLSGEIETGIARLMSPTGMGSRFKTLGVRSPGIPPLPGFPPATLSSASARYGG